MLISYTRRNINTITIIFTVIIFLAFNYTETKVYKIYNEIIYAQKEEVGMEVKFEDQNYIEKLNDSEDKVLKVTENNNNLSNKKEDVVWRIKIPKIKLTAPINSGTTDKVMNKYVGHFEKTSKWKGNVGLAAHNRRISSKLL